MARDERRGTRGGNRRKRGDARSVICGGPVADNLQENLLEIHFVLCGEIRDPSFDLEFALVDDRDPITNRFDFPEFVEATRQLGLYWLVLNQGPPR